VQGVHIKMSDHKDIAGQEIKVGDYICYAALWDRSATMKFGKVTRLADRDEAYVYNRERKKIPTIRLRSVDRDWHDKWKVQAKGKEITLGYLDRLIVVPAELVPPAAKELLDV
jgi:hypothetical protein